MALLAGLVERRGVMTVGFSALTLFMLMQSWQSGVMSPYVRRILAVMIFWRWIHMTKHYVSGVTLGPVVLPILKASGEIRGFRGALKAPTKSLVPSVAPQCAREKTSDWTLIPLCGMIFPNSHCTFSMQFFTRVVVQC